MDHVKSAMRAAGKKKRGPYRFRNGQQLPSDLGKQWLLISAPLGATIKFIIICENHKLS
jgi:hypothetical protein